MVIHLLQIHKQLTQSMTCPSSFNVSGYTTLLNNTTCMNNFNTNGAFYCSSINSATATNLQANLNSLSSQSYF